MPDPAPIAAPVPRWILATLAVLALIAWPALFLYKIHWLHHGGWQFDDSYMFFRYAMHVRQGLGWSWNPDGIHTYGMTSLLWSWIILPFTYLPGGTPARLTFASWIFSGLAIAATAFSLRLNATTAFFRSWPATLAVVTLTFVIMPPFDNAALSGMETMLSLALVALLTGLTLAQKTHRIAPEALGLVAVGMYLARPESLLAAVLMLALARILIPGVTTRDVLRSFAVLVLGVALTLLAGKAYFGSYLPLPFYLKSRHPYPGYRFRWYPVTFGLALLKSATLYLMLLVLFLRRISWKPLALTAIPYAAVALYLCTVTQIMGFHSRYSVPYIPLLAIPALLAFDGVLALGLHKPLGWTPLRIAALAVVFLFLGRVYPTRLLALAEAHAEHHVLEYPQVTYDAHTRVAPEIGYFPSMNAFDELTAMLPAGATVASSEVGRSGATHLGLNIVDIAGLNDRAIALDGYTDAYLLQRRPDLIWFPHPDYTFQRGTMLTDPELLRQYDLYAGAFDFGLAIRKDSPNAPALRAKLAQMWPRLYPNSTPEQSRATTTHWTPTATVPPSIPHKP